MFRIIGWSSNNDVINKSTIEFDPHLSIEQIINETQLDQKFTAWTVDFVENSPLRVTVFKSAARTSFLISKLASVHKLRSG